MPICLMARTFMTRHFLNGLRGSSSSFPLVFFSLSLSVCTVENAMTMTTERNKTKEDGDEEKRILHYWLGCVF